MSQGRSVHFLAALGEASTSRVLNLGHIARANKDNWEHGTNPLFVTPALNTAFVIKQRLRSDEAYQFTCPRATITKIITPFDPEDLNAGGRSIIVDQRGFLGAIQLLGDCDSGALERDLKVLRLLNALPSLDPFLLREHLANYKIDVASCYFTISENDQSSMRELVTAELTRLTRLLGSDASSSSAQRMVSAMLSSDVAEELAPLRQTLNLTGDDFRRGVFSWRGFLYYKWSVAKVWPEVMGVLREISQLSPEGALTSEQKTYLFNARRCIIELVRDNSNDVSKALSIYDTSFADLVARQAPRAFREFLLSAPGMFLEIGEKIGAISHIVSLWRLRFPFGSPVAIDFGELIMLYQDFTSNFAEKIKGAPSIMKQPEIIDAMDGR